MLQLRAVSKCVALCLFACSQRLSYQPSVGGRLHRWTRSARQSGVGRLRANNLSGRGNGSGKRGGVARWRNRPSKPVSRSVDDGAERADPRAPGHRSARRAGLVRARGGGWTPYFLRRAAAHRSR